VSTRRATLTFTCLIVVGVIAVGISDLPNGPATGGPTSTRLTAAQASALLAGSPPALAALHAQASLLLEGGGPALRARLSALRGYPVVINKWASWCGACKEEFGAFQRASAEYGRRVAFLGLDSAEPNRNEAAAFLRSFPVSYPSYYDRSGQLGERITYSPNTPITLFLGRDGRQFIHQGQYPNVQKLERDIVRYALNA
jgi:thiol-disulfide isomerase/thioredoxin